VPDGEWARDVTVQVNLPISRQEESASKLGALLGPLTVLALQKKTWSPLTLAGVLWRAATNIGRHRGVLRLRRNPIYAEHIERDPRFLFKYLTHDYLSRSMSVAERASCFVHHYRRFYAELPDGMLRRILTGELQLMEMCEQGHRFAITLGLSEPWDKEGELSLNLRVDGQLAYVLSFSIVPGKAVGVHAPEVLLIARLQGERGAYGIIANATKAMRSVAPAALLLSALEGLGVALGIEAVASVRGINQTSYREEFDHNFRSAYDDFFSALGVELNPAGYFTTSIPMPEKPMEEIKRGHKLRTREKREFKRRVAAEVCQLMRVCRRGRVLEFPPHTRPAEPEMSRRRVFGD